MPTIHINRKIELSEASPELERHLRSLLTISNPVWEDAEKFGRYNKHIPRHLYQFEVRDNTLVLPRGLLAHLLYDLGLEWNIVDERVAPAANWSIGKIKLRPEDQEPAVLQLLQHPNGFLSAPAGSGKTVMGLELARRLGLRTLWLTHTMVLKNQAIEEIEALLDIPVKEIGVLHGQSWKVGEQITVGMIPTLQKRELTDLADAFGCVIVDEAHHSPSSTFLQVIGQFNAKHLYGLTATAYRRDRLDAVMFNAIGPKVAEIEHFELFKDERLMLPTIKAKRTDWEPPGSHLMDYHDFMESMVTAAYRNHTIVEDVISEVKPGNCCIILVERTKHAEILAGMLKDRGVSCEFLVGSLDVEGAPKKKKKSLPKKVREKISADFKSGKIHVLVTTYDLLMEGFNYKPLNRLFFASPIKWEGSVVQALGRIQRPSEGKHDAIAYDYVDDRIQMFANQFESRLIRVYKEMGMPVEYIE